MMLRPQQCIHDDTCSVISGPVISAGKSPRPDPGNRADGGRHRRLGLGPIPVSLAFDTWGDPTGMLLATAVYPIVVAVIAVIFLATHPAVEGTEHLE